MAFSNFHKITQEASEYIGITGYIYHVRYDNDSKGLHLNLKSKTITGLLIECLNALKLSLKSKRIKEFNLSIFIHNVVYKVKKIIKSMQTEEINVYVPARFFWDVLNQVPEFSLTIKQDFPGMVKKGRFLYKIYIKND